MQLYGIGQPLTNQMLKFSGNQFGPQQFNNGSAPTVQPKFPGQANSFVPQPTVPQTPQTPAQPQNALAPQRTLSPDFQLPQFQPKMGIPGTGPNSITGGFDVNYLTPNRG